MTQNTEREQVSLDPSELAALADGLESIEGNENAARAAVILRQISDAPITDRNTAIEECALAAERAVSVAYCSKEAWRVMQETSQDCAAEIRKLKSKAPKIAAPAAQGDALPWDDCKIAYAIEDEDALWAAYDAHKLRLPKGWSLIETDTSGARAVAVFRVDGLPNVIDGEKVRAALKENGNG